MTLRGATVGGSLLVTTLLCGSASPARGNDSQSASAIIDKAVNALGGAQKLGAVKAFAWHSKGKLTINGDENEFTSKHTVQGLDHFRQEFEGTFGGNPVKGMTVLDGDKGWRKFGDNSRALENEGLASQKRVVYLQVIPMTVLPLKDPSYHAQAGSEEKVGDKPAVSVKATGPDGKEFQLFFDKESGLPVKEIAKVAGRNGDEYTQETTFKNYKDFGGIKRPTKIETKRNGEKFIEQELSDFKVLDKVDPTTFAEPKGD